MLVSISCYPHRRGRCAGVRLPAVQRPPALDAPRPPRTPDPRARGTTLLAPNTLTRSFQNIPLGILIHSIEHKRFLFYVSTGTMFGCGTSLKICSVVNMYWVPEVPEATSQRNTNIVRWFCLIFKFEASVVSTVQVKIIRDGKQASQLSVARCDLLVCARRCHLYVHKYHHICLAISTPRSTRALKFGGRSKNLCRIPHTSPPTPRLQQFCFCSVGDSTLCLHMYLTYVLTGHFASARFVHGFIHFFVTLSRFRAIVLCTYHAAAPLFSS